MAKHQNNGYCTKCQEIFNKFSGFNQALREWFQEFQKQNPEAHISCAGRGFADQMQAYKDGASRARFGQSAHNYGCAIDLFVNLKDKSIYDKDWFMEKVAPNIPENLVWYGAPGSTFYELPHIELKDWRHLKERGEISLISDQNNKTKLV